MNIRRFLMIGLTCIGLCAAWAAAKQSPIPPSVILNNEQGEQVQLYAKSYALLIGVSDYDTWRDLPGVTDDIAAVKSALWQHGFEVATIENPTGRNLRSQFEGFIKKYARDFDNRIVVYFAGHGATLTFADGRTMGYVVPSDAPNPQKDQAGFEDIALDMQTIETYAKQIRSKHALFVFDSCFSGSVFYVTRAGVPPAISYKAAKPVRQLITSGSESEQVPDRRIFREQFVAALNGDGSDLNGDGYLTGEELGFFLEDKVINYSNDTQHPQYGKIREPNLDKGDVVFALRHAQGTPTPVSTPLSVTDDAPQMTAAFEQVRQYEQQSHTAAKKAAAWQKFAAAFKEDNPYDAQDEERRSYAAQRIEALQIVEPTPTPPPPPPQQGGEQDTPSPSGRVGVGCWENATPGATCAEETTGMEFVYVPGDCFMMGSNDYDSEKPVHKVCLDGFWMGKYEVTQTQWEAIMKNNPSNFKGADRPVEMVSWNDAQAFLKQLNVGATGRSPVQFRLPSEAEWEYAARAGTQTAYSFGDDSNRLGDYAWYDDNSGNQTHPVGQKQPNAFGLYDMHGNVWEWVADTYHENYEGASDDGSLWGDLGDKKAKVLRGGSCLSGAIYCRSAFRDWGTPDPQRFLQGFRVVVAAR